MDKPRIGHARRKRIRRNVAGSGAVAAFLAVAWAAARIEPAAPGVEVAVVFSDTVKLGEMVRQLRGIGPLVPETAAVIAASDTGRIEKRFVQPSQAVGPGTVLLELSSPQVEQEYLDATAQLKEARADLANLQAQLEDEHLTRASVTADVEGQYLQAKAQYDADFEVAKSGLTDHVTLVKSRVTTEQLRKRVQLERIREDTLKPSVQAQRARIEQMEVLVSLRKEKVDRLRVRAGIDGVLQLMDVEVGQSVAPGDELGRVSDPTHLKAELKVPETLVNDVAVGKRAEADTRNGVIAGEVSRIDPAAVDGTVLVDIRLLGTMPRGARPDLSVDGTIELERLENVLHVGRPIHAREDSVVGAFKLDGNQTHASRVQVQAGKVSVSTIEVRLGLSEGDTMVLSGMSAWDDHDRIRLE
ncbi:MAG: efflux RND transporter periplasmic adaptor subunit [Bryobacterales bacterium]|nr:efflux RND transporter periplasmic adaptor subunit [Bryobacterales bacterium]